MCIHIFASVLWKVKANCNCHSLRPDDLQKVNRLVHALAINWWTCHEEFVDEEAIGKTKITAGYGHFPLKWDEFDQNLWFFGS